MFDDRLNEPLGLLTVLSMRGVGATTADKVVAAFGSLRELHEADPAACKGVLNKTQAEAFRDAASLWAARDAAQAILARAADCGVRVVTAFSDEFPQRFAGIEDRPLLLYVQGDLSVAERSVAVIGTREPSRFGEVVARRLTDYLLDAGWTPAATLTHGVAAIAQGAALDRGVPSLAVISGGHDLLASDRQSELADRILEMGGAVVGEHPIGREPETGSIIRCHRLMTGLSAGTVIVQAIESEMPMQAARYATMQGRPLYVPFPTGAHAEDPLNKGPLMLATGNGMDLVRAIGAKNEFVSLVSERYMDSPLAKPLVSRDDYPAMIADFEASHSAHAKAEPVAAYG